MDLFTELFAVGLRTTAVFLYAFLLLRLMGKRHLAHLKYTDVLVIIAFGSAVGDVMIYGEDVVHVYTSMFAMTIVTALVKILEEVSSHNGAAERLLEGHAQLIIDRGKVQSPALERENLSIETVESLLREKGVLSITDVRKAFIEPDGELSVIPYERHKRHH